MADTYRPTIALDYDGTIVSNAWPDHGKPEPGAAAAIKRLTSKYNVLVHTARIAPFTPDGKPRTGSEVAKEVTAIHNKLRQMGLPWLPIHQLPWKPGADLYVDDKGLWHRDWTSTEQEIKARLEAQEIAYMLRKAQAVASE